MDKINETVTSLALRIEQAFSTSNLPPETIVLHDCDECRRLSENFQGKKRQNLEAVLISENYDQLPLFSTEAFRYFLPSFMLHALKNLEADNVAEFTVYALLPKIDDEKYFRDRFRSFSREQMHAIYEFLYFMKENGPTIINEKLIDRLKKFTSYIEEK